MSTNLQLYKGYYGGSTPTELDPQPFDVAQDLSTGNLWQYTGSIWLAPSWTTNIDIELGAAETVCERIASAETVIPPGVSLYDGTSEQVPTSLQLSGFDLVIKHNVGNYRISISVYRHDPISETVVQVPFPVGNIVSTEDGNWTALKDFNVRAGFDPCSITLTFAPANNG